MDLWQNGRVPYWFDGNNLIGQSARSSSADRETRRAFLSSLAEYARLKRSRFVVYFDGDDPDRQVPPKGLFVRFSAPHSTDDAIVSRLREISAPSEIIVVTNDHGLRQRCRESGAKAIDWAEFLRTMSIASSRRPSRQPKEEAVDVEDWAEYFGLGKDSLK